MKAVVWHADAQHPCVVDVHDVYKRLFVGLRRNLDKFGVGLIHLTTRGHEKYSDEWVEFDLDPHHVVLNREIAWCEFLKQAPDDHYWLTEPDSRMTSEWPAITTDAMLLRRLDKLPISPAFRVGNPKSLPLFELLRDATQKAPKNTWDWHSDSIGWSEAYKVLGKPEPPYFDYKGVSVELRRYDEYCMIRGKYAENWKASTKADLLRHDGV